MRLQLADALGPDLLEAGHLVGQGPLLERLQAAELDVVEGHDQLARALDGHAVGLAVGLQVGLALAAQPRLQRTRPVVEPGMEDAAVVAGLVGRDRGLLLEDDDAQVGLALEQAQRRGQADDAGADDGHIGALGERRDRTASSSR